jgi:uncharacterized protein YndB with AHSA1/START domain
VSANRIAAERVVAAPQDAVFNFLADLENHWLLDDCFVAVLNLDRPVDGGPARGGSVRMMGPLGLQRTAHTRVVEVKPRSTIAGTALVGHTEARVRWTLNGVPDGTLVRLEARVERRAPLDALLLAMGGRRWMQHRFASILDTLARRVGAVPQSSA